MRVCPRVCCVCRHLFLFALWNVVFIFYLDFDTGPWPPSPPWATRYVAPQTSDDLPCRTPASLAAESNVSSNVKIILAGFGQTGTTSLSAFLGTLGLRVYHAEEMMAFAGRAMRPDTTPPVWARTLSRCRVDVVCIEPALDTLAVAVAASPGAKVIYTFRLAVPWWVSTNRGGSLDNYFAYVMNWFAPAGIRMLPWMDLWDALTGQFTAFWDEGRPYTTTTNLTMTEIIAHNTFIRNRWPTWHFVHRGTRKLSRDAYYDGRLPEETIHSYRNEVESLVPKDQLLIFDIKEHTMKYLIDFLGMPEPPDAAQKLPRATRSKESLSNDAVWMNASWAQRWGFLAICAMCQVVGYAVVTVACRLPLQFCRAAWRFRKAKVA